MNQFRSHEFTAKVLARLEARGEVAAITSNRDPKPSALVLPLQQYAETVAEVYGPEAIEGAQRVNTGTAANGGIGGGVLGDITTNQVDAAGNVSGGVIYVVTLWGDDSAVLVPASPFWLARVVEEAE